MNDQSDDKDSNNNSYASGSALGQSTPYKSDYTPKLLYAIPRSEYRKTVIGFTSDSKMYGYDIWNCYELSWLNEKRKPMVSCARIIIAADSLSIIESKSLKLYLNSLNNQSFASPDSLISQIKIDLSTCIASPVEFQLQNVDSAKLVEDSKSVKGRVNKHELLDDLDISCAEFNRNSGLLALDKTSEELMVEEHLYSHLLRSHCPVTGQPDWGTLTIHYTGAKIDKASLLRYIVSYRNHNGFHEQCVEQIFTDILAECLPKKLIVFAQYTRRGGIDINPFRSSEVDLLHYQASGFVRTGRQ